VVVVESVLTDAAGADGSDATFGVSAGIGSNTGSAADVTGAGVEAETACGVVVGAGSTSICHCGATAASTGISSEAARATTQI
jgi:hypothetical protein